MEIRRTGTFERGAGPTRWYFSDIYIPPWDTAFRLAVNTEPRPHMMEQYPYGCWMHIIQLPGRVFTVNKTRKVFHQNFRYPERAVWEALIWTRVLFRHDLTSILVFDPPLERWEVKELHRRAYGVPEPTTELRSQY